MPNQLLSTALNGPCHVGALELYGRARRGAAVTMLQTGRSEGPTGPEQHLAEGDNSGNRRSTGIALA